MWRWGCGICSKGGQARYKAQALGPAEEHARRTNHWSGVYVWKEHKTTVLEVAKVRDWGSHTVVQRVTEGAARLRSRACGAGAMQAADNGAKGSGGLPILTTDRVNRRIAYREMPNPLLLAGGWRWSGGPACRKCKLLMLTRG